MDSAFVNLFVPTTITGFAFTNRCKCLRVNHGISNISVLRASSSEQNTTVNQQHDTSTTSRRTVLFMLLALAITTPLESESRVVTADPNAGESITKTSTGLQYYDFVTPTESPLVKQGDEVTIQYTMGTTGARNGWRIDYATITLRTDDKQVIKGLSEGLIGMRKGGRRRLLIPPDLGYHSPNDQPIPKGFAEFQRFKNVYLNVNRPFIPDVVFDVTILKIRNL